MAEEKRNLLGPYIPQGNIFNEIVQQVKLAYNLLLDSRVSPVTKLIPIAALAYLIWPFDPLPDFALGLGQLDDLGVLILGLRTFFEFSPPEVVREHLKRLAQAGRWNVADEPPAAGEGSKSDGDVVDGNYRVED
jgi:uncharacterized membrane protein YkvA (DUF1232 family)